MIYAVVGHMRSGTSAMMGALERGGLPAANMERRDRFLKSKRDGEYEINPDKLFELTPGAMSRSDFPEAYDGMAIKIVFQWLKFMKPHWIDQGDGSFRPGYRVVFMVRHPEEIRQSMFSALGNEVSYHMLTEEETKAWWFSYGKNVKVFNEWLRSRKDVLDVKIVKYATLVANPIKIFRALGWPIDIEAAASYIEPKHHRYRLENLTIGL